MCKPSCGKFKLWSWSNTVSQQDRHMGPNIAAVWYICPHFTLHMSRFSWVPSPPCCVYVWLQCCQGALHLHSGLWMFIRQLRQFWLPCPVDSSRPLSVAFCATADVMVCYIGFPSQILEDTVVSRETCLCSWSQRPQLWPAGSTIFRPMARDKHYRERAWQRKLCGIRKQRGVTTSGRRYTLHRCLQVPPSAPTQFCSDLKYITR